MKFFISGEINSLVEEKFRVARRTVEDKLNKYLSKKRYSDTIEEIFLAPIIIDKEQLRNVPRPERKLIQHKEKTVDFRLYLDFKKFNLGNNSAREKLLIKNIIDSVRIIHKRLKNKFKGEELEKDILKLWNLSYDELDT